MTYELIPGEVTRVQETTPPGAHGDGKPLTAAYPFDVEEVKDRERRL
jgi:hypothetical protein